MFYFPLKVKEELVSFFIIINEEKRDREGISWLVPPHRTSS